MTKLNSTDVEARVLMIDNYDSFTWNLYQYLSLLGGSVSVVRSQACTLQQLIQAHPHITHLVISPGPGHPLTDSGISIPAIHHYAGKIPILGICMGLQCIYSAFGGQVSKVGEIVHGKTSAITHDGKGLFKGLPQALHSTRYHSLAGRLGSLPSELEVTSWTQSHPVSTDRPVPFDHQSSIIMGVRHKLFTIESVQYHPESILSQGGQALLLNFLKLRAGLWVENTEFSISSPSSDMPSPAPYIPKSKPSKPTTIVEKICQQRLLDIIHEKSVPGTSPSDLRRKLTANIPPAQIDFYERIRQRTSGDVALMAEIKRASPSKGSFVTASTPSSPEIAISYAAAGASVISVLTEPTWFKGTLTDMLEVRLAVENVPNRPAILRKDFIIDPYQIDQARCYGADSILLIVGCLSPDQLKLLFDHAKSLNMEPLVEVANAAQLELALKVGSRVIGVNNRNLHDFQVDMGRTSQMLGSLNQIRRLDSNKTCSDVLICALSGISGRADVARYVSEGVHAILVGESLMKAEDKKAFAFELLGIPHNPEPMARQPLVKICGIKTVEAALHAANAGADLIGLIFVRKSKRYVDPQQAKLIVRALQSSKSLSSSPVENAGKLDTSDWFSVQASRLLTKLELKGRPLIVGVFQNSSLEEIEEIINEVGDAIDLIQLHGSEDIRISRFLSKPVIKAFHIPIDEKTTENQAETIERSLSTIKRAGYHSFSLLDSSNLDRAGGIGQRFDWNLVNSILTSGSSADPHSRSHHPPPNLIIAGGLNSSNVLDCIKTFKPFMVDICSGVELDHGDQNQAENKDFKKIDDVIELVKRSSS